MKLTLDAIGIGTGPGAPLPATSAEATTRIPGIAAVETEGAPTLASLIAGGRMKPETGRVLLDGSDDPAAIRNAFALVDTPTVAEPFADLSVMTVVREELVLADHHGDRENARRFLDAVGLTAYENAPVKTIPTEARIRLLTELAILRPRIKGLIVTSPERHGGDTDAWWSVVTDLSARGFTVMVVTGVAAALHLQRLLPIDDGVDTPTEPTAVSPDSAPTESVES
jgi:ABC-2 type transport system ATP-binding protein